MQRRQGSLFDASFETVAHNQIVTFTELFHKWHQIKEIIGVVGISHDYIFAERSITTAYKSSSITFL